MNKNIVNKPPKPDNSDYKPKKDRSFKIILSTILAFFIGFGLCVSFYSLTLISIFDFSKFIAAFTVTGFLIPLRFYKKWFHFVKYEMIIFNIMGVAPILSGLFLCLNFMFSSDHFTHDYKIEKIYFEGKENYKSIGIILENNVFSGNNKIVDITDIDPEELYGNRHFRVTLGKGLFGYEVIKERKLIK